MITKHCKPVLILFLLLFLVGCREMAASDEFPTPEAATAPTPEPIIEFEENVEEINLVEVTEDGSITDIQGELNLEYPL
ncbi:MAG: PBP1b-binding outer membrane lipoprotein LpoB, partial [Candidatus Promineifilaceae bacterium]